MLKSSIYNEVVIVWDFSDYVGTVKLVKEKNPLRFDFRRQAFFITALGVQGNVSSKRAHRVARGYTYTAEHLHIHGVLHIHFHSHTQGWLRVSCF